MASDTLLTMSVSQQFHAPHSRRWSKKVQPQKSERRFIMKRNIVKAATRVTLLALVVTALTQQALANSREGNSANVTPVASFATTKFAPVQGQSGYWARVVARDATVRDRPGGRVLQVLTSGQYFHVYPSYQNPSWLLGYACPRGNRGCSNRQSTAGYILRSTVSGSAAITAPLLPGEAFFVSAMAEGDNSSLNGAYALAPPALGFATVAMGTLPSQERRVCAREAWMRNDRLWPIELLRAGERFIVERYTDGSKNDGNARWAIGRARNLRGRILVTALCR
jgi:hypothetical protein